MQKCVTELFHEVRPSGLPSQQSAVVSQRQDHPQVLSSRPHPCPSLPCLQCHSSFSFSLRFTSSEVITPRNPVFTHSPNLLSHHSTVVGSTYPSVLLPFLMFQGYVFEVNHKVIFYQAQGLVWLGFVSWNDTLHFLIVVVNIHQFLKLLKASFMKRRFQQ